MELAGYVTVAQAVKHVVCVGVCVVINNLCHRRAVLPRGCGWCVVFGVCALLPLAFGGNHLVEGLLDSAHKIGAGGPDGFSLRLRLAGVVWMSATRHDTTRHTSQQRAAQSAREGERGRE